MGVQGMHGSLLWLVFGGTLALIYGNQKSVALSLQNNHLLNGINKDEILNYQSGRNVQNYPTSCNEIKSSQNGLYVVEPVAGKQLVVQCELKSYDGRWTVIQKNNQKNPRLWEAYWESYKKGFGDPREDFWLGNENIHLLTKQQLHRIQFRLRTSAGIVYTANYDTFWLEAESNCYRIRLGQYSGNAGDAMTSGEPNAGHDNMRFSTSDRDNDLSGTNCAYLGGGGWWYDNCRFANLNTGKGIYWHQLCRGDCQSSEILIQPVHICAEYGAMLGSGYVRDGGDDGVGDGDVAVFRVKRGSGKKDKKGGNSKGKDSHGKDSHGKDSHGKGSHGKDSHGKGSHGKGSHGSDSDGGSSDGGGSHGGGSHSGGSHGGGSDSRDSDGSNSDISHEGDSDEGNGGGGDGGNGGGGDGGGGDGENGGGGDEGGGNGGDGGGGDGGGGGGGNGGGGDGGGGDGGGGGGGNGGGGDGGGGDGGGGGGGNGGGGDGGGGDGGGGGGGNGGGGDGGGGDGGGEGGGNGGGGGGDGGGGNGGGGGSGGGGGNVDPTPNPCG
ncbi:loricrin-like [Pelobates fuscus]|uniref:loricrin-like n=1 Tax=Pelobates fuscus TaxID=191477 RepID=UPI002FE4B8CA